jgi:hypothetical protein
VAQFEMKKLSTADRVVAGLSAAALICLFLPWYGVSQPGVSVTTSGFSAGFGFYGGLCVVAAGVFLVMFRSGVDFHWGSMGPALFVFCLSLVGTLLVVAKWLSLPRVSYAGGLISLGPRFGMFLMIILGVVQAIVAWRLYAKSGERRRR